jgi:hypothetical protein
VADCFTAWQAKAVIRFDRSGLIAEARFYMMCRRLKITSMTAMMIRMCTQFPVRGKLELMFRPKAPSSHSITRITMIVHNMRFLLLNNLMKDLSDATWSLDRVIFDLAAQQDEDAGSDGKDSHNHTQARKAQAEQRD